ncbi:MAG TPA: TetR/AcrR family transcriptional regulator [Stellaceae bacterium]|nr:TetR/AcrR family transcriptional regulator [Stellaceae bacterium]
MLLRFLLERHRIVAITNYMLSAHTVLSVTDPSAHPPRRGRGGRPSRLQSAQLSDRILDVATALFLGHGFGTTSIEAVAKRAGISKRTFYHRFRGKEVLFEAVVRRLIERWMPPFDSALLDAPDIDAALRRAAAHILGIALTPEALALHRMVIAEARQFPGLARIMHELGAASGVERISRDLDRRIAGGEIGPIDTRMAAEQFILMVVTAPQRRSLGLGTPMAEVELSAWIEGTVGLFLDGCRARANGAAQTRR